MFVKSSQFLSNLNKLNLLFKRSKRPDLSHPALWYEDYPISLIGRRQSPIEISTENCILNNKQMQLAPLELKFPDLFHNLKIRNPKDNSYFGWRVDIPYDHGDQTFLSGGPLEHRYKLIQFHAHWGKNCSCGSEHIINGKHYSAEVHFVHWNSDLYSSPREAAISKDGLAVVAVFLDATSGDEQVESLESLEIISSSISDVKFKGATKHIPKPLNLLELIPKKCSYWTYLGSLTTPPLWETVTWIIFEKPVRCKPEQIDAFRQLSYYSQNDLESYGMDAYFQANVEENYRPIQPLNGRPIIYVNRKPDNC